MPLNASQQEIASSQQGDGPLPEDVNFQPTQADIVSENEHSILFFDGVCGLCNKTVDFVLSHDLHGTFHFAPLQGETAKIRLSPHDTQQLSTVVLVDSTGVHRRSAAIIRLLWGIGGVWNVLGWLLWLIPAPLRDLGYRMVSRFRYRIWGEKESCRMPTEAERGRIFP